MAKLVIAEKPSVGKAIAAVIGADKRRNGYFEGNGYIVSWCVGRMADLASADVYDPKYEKWTVKDLPVIPDPWHWSIGRDRDQQFFLLKNLMSRHDVDEVINACDAGREGELIFRTVYNIAKCVKPVKRLWISSMEDHAILAGFNDLKDGKEYDNLYASALCRSKADWLVGINATRLFSVLYHRTLNVGRVVSPTLALIVQREADIDAFKPEPFYTVEAAFEGFTAATERISDLAEADTICKECPGQSMVVKSVEKKEKTEKAPALYDLTTLQRDANRLLGYTAQQTLDYLQSLYEKKVVTYPRTDSRYLPESMKGTLVNELTVGAAAISGLPFPDGMDAGRVCNDKKVTDHHAIIPTATAVTTDTSSLSAGEQAILALVARQLLIAVSDPCRWEETEIILENKEAVFKAKGKHVITEGWKAYAEKEQDEKEVPMLKQWDLLVPDSAEVKNGYTAPPRHFTEDTLLNSMETAGKEEMPEDAERKGLGTPATRATIIEKLVDTKFVERRKGKKHSYLIPTNTGRSLITVLPEVLQSPLLTAEWENRLKQIEKGEADPDEFMRDIAALVEDLVKNYEPVKGSEVLFPSGREIVGKCPRCGSSVTESRLGYFCENNECKFGLWRDNRFLTSKKIDLNGKMVSSLLKDGRTYVCGIWSERTGKTYNAFICLNDDGSRVGYKLEFENDNN